MKLARLKRGGRDGTLVVVDRNMSNAVAVPEVALTLQGALDDWPRAAPALEAVYEELQGGGHADVGLARSNLVPREEGHARHAVRPGPFAEGLEIVHLVGCGCDQELRQQAPIIPGDQGRFHIQWSPFPERRPAQLRIP